MSGNFEHKSSNQDKFMFFSHVNKILYYNMWNIDHGTFFVVVLKDECQFSPS